MGDVERDHRDRDAAVEDDRRGVRVDMDVEFGGRRHIAELEASAAHDHQFADPAGNLRRLDERHGDVGQRPQCAQGDRAGSAPRNVSIRKSTPCCGCSAIVGSGNSRRSRAVSPWICSAVASGRSSGRAQPA